MGLLEKNGQKKPLRGSDLAAEPEGTSMGGAQRSSASTQERKQHMLRPRAGMNLVLKKPYDGRCSCGTGGDRWDKVLKVGRGSSDKSQLQGEKISRWIHLLS